MWSCCVHSCAIILIHALIISHVAFHANSVGIKMSCPALFNSFYIYTPFVEKSISKSLQSSMSTLVPEDRELVLCSHYLRFPVEAACILTNTEFKLFQDVRSSCYVNYIRNNGLRFPYVEQESNKKTIHDLKDRCEKVSSRKLTIMIVIRL